MNKLILISAITITLSSCVDSSSDDNEKTTTSTVASLTEDEKKDGWQLLFDGTSTKGWHSYGETTAGKAWKVDSGTIHLDASVKVDGKVVGGGDLTTDSAYDNFHLKLEWKIDSNSNSGMIFYVNEDTTKYKKSYETGPEMQVLDNKGHPDSKIIKHRAGDLYDLISCSKETVKPALQWNAAEIKSVNGKLELWLNGENVVSTTLWDDNWRAMLANSKFKQWADFGTFKKGKICLQDHGDNVWYRNIKIRKL